jgi:hypothetical protein
MFHASRVSRLFRCLLKNVAKRLLVYSFFLKSFSIVTLFDHAKTMILIILVLILHLTSISFCCMIRCFFQDENIAEIQLIDLLRSIIDIK